MGLMREPAKVNRRGRKQPTWEELLDVAVPAEPKAADVTPARVAQQASATTTPGETVRLAQVVAMAHERARRALRPRGGDAASDPREAADLRRVAEPAE
jgi:hypothetical protein